MHYFKKNLIILLGLIVILSIPVFSQEYIADYKVSKESVLRAIPEWAITAAKNNLHIMYAGTSHSSQTVDGMRGLMEYKTGDNSLFAVTFNGTPVPDSLDIHYRPELPVNVYDVEDLSNDGLDVDGHTEYFRITVEYLDNPDHGDINVVMWAWCTTEGHDVQIYLDNFQELINMYRAGGPKERTASNEVKFVFMTGHAIGYDGDTPEPPYIRSPYQNHKRIVDFCRANNYFCLDYWSQDTYQYETDFYKPSENGNYNVQHLAYVNSHTLGQDWFQGRDWYNGSVRLPAHANQHLTGNRRAYGAWWIWARLAGWSGSGKSIEIISPNGGNSWQFGSSKNITWTASGLSNDVKITLWKDGSLIGLIAKDINPSSGTYNWTVGSHTGGTASPGSGYRIKIREQGGALFTTEDISDAGFDISQLTITSPNGGNSWQFGSSKNITWTAGGLTNDIKITLWKDGTFAGLIVKDIDPSSGTYSWTVGTHTAGTVSAGTGYKIKIREQGGSLFTTEDISDTGFNITQLNVTSPNGGNSWQFGSSKNITWTASDLTNDIKITLWKDGAFVGLIVKDIDPSSGTYSWTVGTHTAGTASAGTGYKIKIREQGGSLFTTEDISDVSFNISQLTIISPNGSENWTIGNSRNITWTASGLINDVKITLWKDGSLIGLIVKDLNPSSGTYSWTVGNHSGGTTSSGSGYMIKIREQGGALFTTEDISDTDFNLND